MRRAAAAWLLGAGMVSAAPPKLDALYPAGIQGGAETEVRALGTFSTWPVETWCSDDRVRITCAEEKGLLLMHAPKVSALSPCLVRLHAQDGVSDARIFVIGPHRELLEIDENQVPSRAQEVGALPCVIQGRLEKSGDTDFYQLSLKKGQLLYARLDGYALRSAIDPFLMVTDERGFELALASDHLTLDPRLLFVAPYSGTFLLQVAAFGHKASASVQYAGAEGSVYRLQLEHEAPRPPEPPAAKRKESEGYELEPPTQVLGRIGKRAERDRYTFKGIKGRSLRIRVEAAVHDSPLDAVFRIERNPGTPLGPYDDTKTGKDPEYLLACADAEYTVEVADLFRRGGPMHFYRLVIEEPAPGFRLTAEADRVTVQAGGEGSLKLKLERLDGHEAELRIEAEGLPDGVTLHVPEMPKKSGSVALKLKANASAKPGNTAFTLKAYQGDAARDIRFSYQSTESRGAYLVEDTGMLWLTIPPTAEP